MFSQLKIQIILFIVITLILAVENRTFQLENRMEYDLNINSAALLVQSGRLLPIDYHHLNSIHNKDAAVQEIEEISKDTDEMGSDANAIENLCVILYVGTFGSLVCLFLIITCTEFIARNSLQSNRRRCDQNGVTDEKPGVPESPPPPYRLFAPPDYCASLHSLSKSQNIIIAPVHRNSDSRTDDNVPHYQEAVRTISQRDF